MPDTRTISHTIPFPVFLDRMVALREAVAYAIQRLPAEEALVLAGAIRELDLPDGFGNLNTVLDQWEAVTRRHAEILANSVEWEAPDPTPAEVALTRAEAVWREGRERSIVSSIRDGSWRRQSTQ